MAKEIYFGNLRLYLFSMPQLDDDKYLEFRILLQNEFSRRCQSNPRYSVRAFARDVELDPSSISQILSGSRRVSEKMRLKIANKIGLDLKKRDHKATDEKYLLLSLDTIAAISDWHHFAILDLTLLPGFKSEIPWIAKKLNISLTETRTSIDRLKRLGLLVEKSGKLCKSKSHFSNYDKGVTSQAHKEYQRQIITKALQAVDMCAQERKDITSITIAADSSKLPEVREKIKQFRREMCDFLETGTRDSVYHLAVQLYPVTGIEN